MNNLKDKLQLIPVTIDNMEFYRMSIPMKEICERVGKAGFEVYDELRKQGFVIDRFNRKIKLRMQLKYITSV